MSLVQNLLWRPLVKKTRNPQTAQDKLLKRILQTNRKTVFGKAHHFSRITNYQTFVASVPVQSYEDLRKHIEKQEDEKKPYLNQEDPVIYTQTSGTTGQPKYIPIFKSTLSQLQQVQQIFSYVQYKAISGVFSGKILSIVSPAVEGHLASGVPYGSMSGLLYKNLPRFMRSKFVVPYPVYEVEDYELKYLLIAAFSIAEKNLSCMASPNPSTFLKLADLINTHKEQLLECIETGKLESLGHRNETLKLNEHIRRCFRKQPVRARELRELSSKRALRFDEIWPHLKSVVTWTGGSCGILIPALKEQLASSTKVVELGYLSSEFRGTITIDALDNIEIPSLDENFYEFIAVNDLENEDPSFLRLKEIAQDRQYYIIATTQNGLYRYFINDIIEVVGFYNKTPMIRFVQKGKGVTNITGEKLYEPQLLQALEQLKAACHLDFNFYMMLADQDAMQYRLYIEHDPVLSTDLPEKIERQLYKLNLEYESKRKSGRLNPLKLYFLKPGSSEVYKKHCLQKGQREGQYKVVPLQYFRECSFDFTSFIHSLN